MFLFVVFAGVLSAASNLVYVYLPELFPTSLRASGIGLAIAASRIGSAASTFLLPIVVSRYGVHVALGSVRRGAGVRRAGLSPVGAGDPALSSWIRWNEAS